MLSAVCQQANATKVAVRDAFDAPAGPAAPIGHVVTDASKQLEHLEALRNENQRSSVREEDVGVGNLETKTSRSSNTTSRNKIFQRIRFPNRRNRGPRNSRTSRKLFHGPLTAELNKHWRTDGSGTSMKRNLGAFDALEALRSGLQARRQSGDLKLPELEQKKRAKSKKPRSRSNVDH